MSSHAVSGKVLCSAICSIGMPRYRRMPRSPSMKVICDWHEAVEVAYDRDMLTEPGTTFFYSNANFVVLGALIEQVTGLPYEQAVHQLVLDPLGIVTAELVDTEEQPQGDPGYAVTPGRLYMEALGPAGGWVMTATDAARLMPGMKPKCYRCVRCIQLVGLDRNHRRSLRSEPVVAHGSIQSARRPKSA